MNLLLIDNSNTRTKFARSATPGKVDAGIWHFTADISRETLAASLADWTIDAAILCSVVPQKSSLIQDFLTATDIPFHLLGPHSPLGIDIDYPKPNAIGADRLANAVGVTHFYGCPAIVIDFGTAITFDIISAKPAYLGGVIAPGLGAVQDYLGKKTALLPLITPRSTTTAIGKSTAAAMSIGTIIGYRGLVREIIQEIRKELSASPIIVATGGDAELIVGEANMVDQIDPRLTLRGMELVGRRVFEGNNGK